VGRVGLFIPCYIDDFYPDVAMATLDILEANGFLVDYPFSQNCCGQPFVNNGFIDEAKELAEKFYETFQEYDYIVAPSSSCIGTVKYRYRGILSDEQFETLSRKSFELCEFLYDVVGVDRLIIPNPYRGRVGLHNSCHSIRELKLCSPSELNISHYSKIRAILSKMEDLIVLEPSRDECCGFGGTYSIMEPEVSVMMGRDRINEHLKNRVSMMVGVDSSCLMHMEAIAKKNRINMKFYHIAQILARGDEI
jgi:L-lactate dehydrogenase complex protein LldE